jgi:tetratricopeptide (TPR) repeat protein
MRGAAVVLAIAALLGGAVALALHARGGAVDRQLAAELTAALDRGGVADLGRAQALGRRLVFGGGAGRGEAAALAFAEARLALDYGVAATAEAEEVLARFRLPDGRGDAAALIAASAQAMLAARKGDRAAALRIAAAAAAREAGLPHPLYALGRARALAGDLGGAARAFDAAVVLSPAFLAARVALAEVGLDFGNAPGAHETLTWVLGEAPDDMQAQMLMAEAQTATASGSGGPREAPVCAGERWRPRAIAAACLLARAERERRAGNRPAARADAEAAGRAIPDEPRLLARGALMLAGLGAVDQAAALVARAQPLAAPQMPALAWATAAVALGRGRDGPLPAGIRPAGPETDLLLARASLAAGGLPALQAELAFGLGGPNARAGDADLDRLARAVHRPRPLPALAPDDPMQAYLDGVAAELAGDPPRAAARLRQALSGHGDACRAAGEYVAALRAQRLRPAPAAFTPLRAENAHCVNLR